VNYAVATVEGLEECSINTKHPLHECLRGGPAAFEVRGLFRRGVKTAFSRKAGAALTTVPSQLCIQ